MYLFEFQYISCYGLSWKKKQAEIPVRIFQYISCYGLSHSAGFAVRWYRYFNTSHVTVYRCFLFTASCTIIISIHLMLRFIIYPDGEKVNISEFQYISCYGLSELNQNTYEEIKEFQYISCYGLSNMDPWMLFQYCDFNTSHVTVYRFRPSTTCDSLRNFNTSHVTVYLMILSHSYLGIFHHFLYSTSFQHFLPADYKI